ncbi:serine/threonine-protein kinase [Actinoplanes subglobosus]|uniref:non-specific serine/threonine protein kinase n=1 Tax=Actinoplanes subglobosus TaxID=1547892 RepID=A0ABV8J5C1_9ACTN
MLSAGVVLHGRYQLTRPVAAGGMGEVWRADDLLLHREIAVKVLLPGLMADKQFVARFRAEARMMASLKHPGIAPIHDYGENAQVGPHRFDYLVMEFIDGTPLSTRIQQAGRLDVAETMAVVAQVADALRAAHQAGIVHRDVKPNNLLLRPGGEVVLVDFGVARSDGLTSLTGTGVVLGTVHFMAPEQAAGRPVSAATDVYSLGAVAFSCLAGRPPYEGDSSLAVLAQLLHGKPPELPPDVPAEAAALVSRAMARDPAQRFASAAELATAARKLATPAPTAPATPTTPTAPAAPATPADDTKVVVPRVSAPTRLAGSPQAGRRWTAVTVAVVAAILLAGAGAWGGRLLKDDTTDTPSGAAGSPAASSGTPSPSKVTPSVTTVRAHTPAEICSAGTSPYRIVDSRKLKTSRGVLKGVVYLLYSDTDGSHCAVTIKEKGVGKSLEAAVAVHIKGELGLVNSDGGGEYAVMYSGKNGQCVRWSGWMGDDISFASETRHCG